ncbi:chemotaxis protein CheD [Aquipseudomonas guryensis]|uniref:Probable chemoreceptor glutamine deamidase CheD n=1 Tax=Aquipseudomonas guryensis TaxID=2759165 RepID=A0A7W4H460_9GAMM|nr:chemotaxis protein CheD [Pseudomonas guryensis]MBB1520343.1 chemotaxis protein CheD [Pseudomonas guryensis]
MNRKRFLNPGGLYFGSGELWVETLLGPCVSIVMWFPEVRKGGMCHFQLPGKRQVVEHARDLDGRYGRDAWIWLKQQTRVHALNLSAAEIKLFGGSRSLNNPGSSMRQEIGAQNIEFVERLVAETGVRVVGRDLGGDGYRYLRFDLATGEVWVRRGGALNIKALEEMQ